MLYGLLVFPWPGLHHPAGAYIRAFGSLVFGQTGRVFMANLAKIRTGAASVSTHHVVLFRARGPTDKSYSEATDIFVVLYNFDVVDKGVPTGGIVSIESKQSFWLPFSFYIALVGATPMPWRRRAWALFWGIIAAHVFLTLRLGVTIADQASNISMLTLTPFWKSTVSGMVKLMLVPSGPSMLAYAFVWVFASFRRQDLARWVAGGRESIPAPTGESLPTRQQKRAQHRAARKSHQSADPASHNTLENQQTKDH